MIRLGVVFVDGKGWIVKLHAAVYEVSIVNLLNREECWSSRCCPCGFADKTYDLFITSSATDRYSTTFKI